MRKDKRILYVCPRAPFPPDYGYPIRAFNVGRILSSGHRVDLLFITSKDLDAEQDRELGKVFERVVVFKKRPGQFLGNAVLGLFRRDPLQVSYHYFRDVQDWITSHAPDYDLIFCSTVRVAKYLMDPRISTRKAIDFVDSISLNYQGAARLVRNNFWRAIYVFEKGRLLRYEREILNRFDTAFITSEPDRRFIAGDSVKNFEKLSTTPNGVNLDYLKRRAVKEQEQVVFLGKMDYPPNEDAALYFANKIWPGIRRRLGGAEFIVVGMEPTELIKGLESIPGVRVTGYVEDPSDHLLRAKVVVAPLRFGAGIQNKILEAMALGRPVVTTPIAVGGIPGAEDGVHLVVTDPSDSRVFGEAVLNLLENEPLRREIGKNARDFIRNNYTWEHARRKLIRNLF